MGRRSEPRIAISFPVTVRGTDAHGSAFAINANTVDISFSGVMIQGLDHLATPGAKMEVQCRDQSAWYRVQWVGHPLSVRAKCIGLRCLETGKYIWGVQPKEWEADTYDPSSPTTVPAAPLAAAANSGAWTGEDRRQFARHVCCIQAQIYLDRDSSETSAKITDISLGGCYLEMLSPLPVGTTVRIALNAAEATLNLTAKVRSSQSGFGMGVSFTGMAALDFERLRKFAPPTMDDAPQNSAPATAASKVPASHPSPERAKPSPAAARSYGIADDEPLDLSSPAEALDALVRLLLRKQIFTRGELAEELEKMKFTLS